MSAKEIVITPKFASDLLECNVNNRKLSDRRASALADAMKRGEWQFNGDTIRIAKSGRLLDGQHRLRAIEVSGLSQRCIIVDGLDDDTFTTIDTGSSRTAGQMLSMSGETNSNTLAAAARKHLLYKYTGSPKPKAQEKTPTHTQIVDFAETSKELRDSVFYVRKKWLCTYVGASISAFCHFEFGLVDPAARDRFFEELISGEFSYHNSPIRFLRDVLIEERGARYTPDRTRRIAIIFKAFRLYREGIPMKIIRLPKDQAGWFEL